MRAVNPDTTELPADGKSRYTLELPVQNYISATLLRVTAARITPRSPLGRCRGQLGHRWSHPLQRRLSSAARRHAAEKNSLTLPTIRAKCRSSPLGPDSKSFFSAANDLPGLAVTASHFGLSIKLAFV